MQQELQQIYVHYKAGEFTQAKAILKKISQNNSQNPYVQRYKKLLENEGDSSGDKQDKANTPRIKGKLLSCPKCQSRISYSSMNEEQKVAIKAGEYNNLELKCPYCHSEFILQRKKKKALLGLKIGSVGNFEEGEYRVTGYTCYSGEYLEYARGRYSEGGTVKFLEWILLGKDGSYKYLSESTSRWVGGSETTFELSEKYIPDGKIEVQLEKLSFTIDGKHDYFQESSHVKVESVYGENSKSYTIGEKVDLYEAAGLVYESESSGSQKEVGFYKERELSKNELKKIFGEDLQISLRGSGTSGNPNYGVNILVYGSILGVFLVQISFFLTLGLIVSVVIYLLFLNKLSSEKKYDILKIAGAGICSLIIMFFIGRTFASTVTLGDYKKITEPGHYSIFFTNLGKESITKTQKYDYGGVKTTYSQKKGWKFTVKDENDIELLKELQDKNISLIGVQASQTVEGILYQVQGGKVDKLQNFLDF